MTRHNVLEQMQNENEASDDETKKPRAPQYSYAQLAASGNKKTLWAEWAQN